MPLVSVPQRDGSGTYFSRFLRTNLGALVISWGQPARSHIFNNPSLSHVPGPALLFIGSHFERLSAWNPLFGLCFGGPHAKLENAAVGMVLHI